MVVVSVVVMGEPHVPTHGAWASATYSVVPSRDATPRGVYATLLVVYEDALVITPDGDRLKSGRVNCVVMPHAHIAVPPLMETDPYP